jgi:hypothetical protein
MYTIIHHYLTVGDDDQPTVEVESLPWSGDDHIDLLNAIRAMVTHPGGRSGTTITLTVSLTQPARL